jgi:hypothetical protein
MDADDISEPDRFRIQFDFLDSHPDISAVRSTAIHIDESGHETGRSTASPDDLLPWVLIWGNPFYHGSMMIRTAVFREIGGCDPYFRMAQDYDVWLRLLASGCKFVTISQPLLRYRVSNSRVSMTHRPLQDQFAKEALSRYLSTMMGPQMTSQQFEAFWAYSRVERRMVQGEIEQVLKLVRDMATVASARNLPVGRKRVHLFLVAMFLSRAGSWAATSAHTSWSATVAAILFYYWQFGTPGWTSNTGLCLQKEPRMTLEASLLHRYARGLDCPLTIAKWQSQLGVHSWNFTFDRGGYDSFETNFSSSPNGCCNFRSNCTSSAGFVGGNTVYMVSQHLSRLRTWRWNSLGDESQPYWNTKALRRNLKVHRWK